MYSEFERNRKEVVAYLKVAIRYLNVNNEEIKDRH
jgi:hypothetical protein